VFGLLICKHDGRGNIWVEKKVKICTHFLAFKLISIVTWNHWWHQFVRQYACAKNNILWIFANKGHHRRIGDERNFVLLNCSSIISNTLSLVFGLLICKHDGRGNIWVEKKVKICTHFLAFNSKEIPLLTFPSLMTCWC
jgi:hypothetical protein